MPIRFTSIQLNKPPSLERRRPVRQDTTRVVPLRITIGNVKARMPASFNQDSGGFSVKFVRQQAIFSVSQRLALVLMLFVACAAMGLEKLVAGPFQDENASAAPQQVDRPVIDDEVQRHMEGIGATAATLAITFEGRIVYRKGFGFSDRRKKIPTQLRTTMRIASCTKPFTAAAIFELIDSGDLTEDTPVFEFLGIAPVGELADERVRDITVAHLLEHQGGWDHNQTFDPLYQIAAIKKNLRVRRVEKRHIVRYMWKQPLQFQPGARKSYSNFGYLLLGLVIEKATGKSYINSIRDLVIEPGEGDSISISSPVRSNRRSREVHYPRENKLNYQLRDSASGLTTTSEVLAKFMSKYWITGKPLSGQRFFHFQFGSHPGTTTAMMEQRLDKIHVALIMNSRRDEHYTNDNNALRDALNRAIDWVKDELIKE